MSESKHTKGRWQLDIDDYDLVIRMGSALKDPGRFETQHEVRWEGVLLGLDEDNPQYQEAVANAQLMAASPKLLQACKAALRILPGVHAALRKKLSIAIAEAERAES